LSSLDPAEVRNKISVVLLNSLINHILSYFSKRKDLVNKINVFPVPDGDTGTNIELTIKGGLEYVNKTLAQKGRVSPNDYIRKLAEGMVLNSHGCSGAILSLYFQGLASVLDLENPSNDNIVEALRRGYENAYRGTVDPKEGTMLTLMRELYKKYEEVAKRYSDPLTVIKKVLPYLKDVLERTPEMLPVLKEAGVVDSGALAFYILLEGLLDFFGLSAQETFSKRYPLIGKIYKGILSCSGCYKTYELIRFFLSKAIYYLEPQRALFILKKILRDVMRKGVETAWSRKISYRYCTEFLLTPKERDVEPSQIRLRLENLGDEIFSMRSDSTIKIHIHTNYLEKVLKVVSDFGAVVSVKVDNMERQQEELLSEILSERAKRGNSNAVLIVVNGKGFEEIINSFGYKDVLVLAYEGSRPSERKLAEIVNNTGVEDLLVVIDDSKILPILMSMDDLYRKKRSVVIVRKHVIEVLHVLYNYSEDLDFQEKVKMFSEQEDMPKFFEVVRVEEGEESKYIAIYNNKVINSSSSLKEVIYKGILRLREDESLITLYKGRTEGGEDKQLLNYLKSVLKDLDFEIYYGGQDRCSYYVVLE
jgi:DAK2 domain fusion protein YloV